MAYIYHITVSEALRGSLAFFSGVDRDLEEVLYHCFFRIYLIHVVSAKVHDKEELSLRLQEHGVGNVFPYPRIAELLSHEFEHALHIGVTALDPVSLDVRIVG